MILRILTKPRPNYTGRKIAFVFLMAGFWIVMAVLVLPVALDYWRSLP